MTDPHADELRRRSRFMMAAAVILDLGGIAAIIVPVLNGDDMMTTLPIAIVLFLAAGGLFAAGILTKRKADAAA